MCHLITGLIRYCTVIIINYLKLFIFRTNNIVLIQFLNYFLFFNIFRDLNSLKCIWDVIL